MIQNDSNIEATLSGLQKTMKERGHEKLYATVLHGVLRVLSGDRSSVETVVVATEADFAKYKTAIEAALPTFTTEPKVITDPSIIGGYIAHQHGTRVDASYKTKLVALYRSLTN